MPPVTDLRDRRFDIPGWEEPRSAADAQFLADLNREDICVALFQNAKGDIEDDDYLLLRTVLRSHDPVGRHEGAFAMGEHQHVLAATDLIASVLRDRSPLVRHESSEALGRMKREPDALMAHRTLCDLYFDESYQAHETADVLSTMRTAISELERRFPTLTEFRESKKWPNS